MYDQKKGPFIQTYVWTTETDLEKYISSPNGEL